MANGVDPAQTVVAVAAGVSATQQYVSPTATEASAGVSGVTRMVIGDLEGAQALLAPLGFTVTAGVDPVTQRRFALALSETATPRAWGLYLADLSAPLAACFAVPHPRSDLRCEQLAVRLWRSVPGALLAMATVHRSADAGRADHARNAESLFQRLWTDAWGPRGVPQVQVHGFADDTAPEQAAVSVGAGRPTPAAERVAAELTAAGLVTTRSWDGTADPDVRALTNVQGIAAGAGTWVWVHVELNRTVRTTAKLADAAVGALVAANVPLLALDRPSPGGAGHLPLPGGPAGAAGTSRLLAREDHVHPAIVPEHTHRQPRVRFPPVPVPDQATLAVDASAGDYFRVRLPGDRVLAAPVNGADGQRITVEVTADGDERTLQLDPALLLAAGVPARMTVPTGKRWFYDLVHVAGAGWIVLHVAVQG